MKAFLLAAGKGTRLRPLTDCVPKCLVRIAGRPLLGHWFALCERYGIDEVLVNLHHLPEQVKSYIQMRNFQGRVHLYYEPELLGSAGTLKANRGFVKGEASFFIAYADNLTDVNLEKMLQFHRTHSGVLTMGLFHAPQPQQCGIAQVDDKERIVAFVEKPKHPQSDLANAGIYVARPEFFSYIPDKIPADIGHDVLPQLVGNMYGYVIEEYLLDIGTWENYHKAQGVYSDANRQIVPKPVEDAK